MRVAMASPFAFSDPRATSYSEPKGSFGRLFGKAVFCWSAPGANFHARCAMPRRPGAFIRQKFRQADALQLARGRRGRRSSNHTCRQEEWPTPYPWKLFCQDPPQFAPQLLAQDEPAPNVCLLTSTEDVTAGLDLKRLADGLKRFRKYCSCLPDGG